MFISLNAFNSIEFFDIVNTSISQCFINLELELISIVDIKQWINVIVIEPLSVACALNHGFEVMFVQINLIVRQMQLVMENVYCRPAARSVVKQVHEWRQELVRGAPPEVAGRNKGGSPHVKPVVLMDWHLEVVREELRSERLDDCLNKWPFL